MTFLRFGTLALLVACGGTTVVDEGGTGAGSSTGSNTTGAGGITTTGGQGGTGNTTGSGTTTNCEVLGEAYGAALEDAHHCDSCLEVDPCEYLSGQELTDRCGCPVAVDTTEPAKVQAALQAYQVWTDAGCGPNDCGQPCAISNDPTCEAFDTDCPGACAPF